MRGRNPSRGRKNAESGAVAILVGLLLVALVGIASYVVDIGHFRVVRGELQNAADSAATAGAKSLPNEDDVRDKAHEFGLQHKANQTYVEIPAEDIQIGVWHFEEPVDEAWEFPPDGTRPPNAVRARAASESGQGTEVFTWFARVLPGGPESADIGAEAIAVTGGPGCAFGFPIAIPECFIRDSNGDLLCEDQDLEFSPDGDDVAGWTLLSDEHPNSNGIRALIEAYQDQECGLACSVDTGDEIELQNGVASSAVQTLVDILYPDGAEVPTPIDVWMPVIESDPGCAIKFNQSHTVVGMARIRILDANATGNPKFVRIRLICDDDLCQDVAAGGYNQGAPAGKTRLVR